MASVRKESSGAHGGITRTILKGHATDPKGKVLLKGKGADLSDPTYPLAAPVTVQFSKDGSAVCFEATYDSGHLSSTTSLTKGKTP